MQQRWIYTSKRVCTKRIHRSNIINLRWWNERDKNRSIFHVQPPCKPIVVPTCLLHMNSPLWYEISKIQVVEGTLMSYPLSMLLFHDKITLESVMKWWRLLYFHYHQWLFVVVLCCSMLLNVDAYCCNGCCWWLWMLMMFVLVVVLVCCWWWMLTMVDVDVDDNGC